MSDHVQPRKKFGTRPGVLSSSLLDNTRVYKYVIWNMQYVREGPVGWAGLNQCLLIETLSPDPGLASILCASRVQVWGVFTFHELELDSSRLSPCPRRLIRIRMQEARKCNCGSTRLSQTTHTLYYFESATNPTEFDLWCSMYCHAVFSKRVPSTSTNISSTNNVKVMHWHWISCIFLHGQQWQGVLQLPYNISIDILLGLGYIPTAGGKDPFFIKIYIGNPYTIRRVSSCASDDIIRFLYFYIYFPWNYEVLKNLM